MKTKLAKTKKKNCKNWTDKWIIKKLWKCVEFKKDKKKHENKNGIHGNWKSE